MDCRSPNENRLLSLTSDIVASNFEHNIWIAGDRFKAVAQPDIVASNFEQIYGLQVTDCKLVAQSDIVVSNFERIWIVGDRFKAGCSA